MSELSGAERAAVLLMSVGEEAAASILRHIDTKEVQQVSQAMARLKKISWTQVDAVIAQFQDEVKAETAYALKAADFNRKMLTSSLGEQQATALLNRIGTPPTDPPALEALKWMEHRELVELVSDEHPQVIALIIAMLDAEQSGALIKELDEDLAQDVLIRIARISEISPTAVAEIETMLKARGVATAKPTGQPVALKGTGQAANIFNSIDSELEEKLMQSLREEDADLAQEVENLMFVFDNLMDLDDRGFQKLMREIPNEHLIPALKGTDAALQNRFFNNMSKRAAEMLRDDLEVAGPIRVSDVEHAHKEILAIARRLADDGTISLGAKGGDEFV